MPRRTWQMRRRVPADLTPGLACFLVTGCSGLTCPNDLNDLDIYVGIHAQVLRNRRGRLRALWSAHASTLKAAYPGLQPMFAELILGGMPIHAALVRCGAGRKAEAEDDNDSKGGHTMSPSAQQPTNAQKNFGRAPRPRPNTPGPAAGTPANNPKSPTPTRPADVQGGKASTRPENANPK